MIREPRYSGSFYPEIASQLKALLDTLFKEAPSLNLTGRVKALISPHAGYIYSGKVAASGYSSLRNVNLDNVVIIGPSHHVAFDGMAVFAEGEWITPLGSVEVSKDLAEKILGRSKFIFQDEEMHGVEHSIEVQIPFLQYIAGNSFKILPLMVGFLNEVSLSDISRVLYDFLHAHNDVLLVVSSDLYHGYSHKECVETDRRTINAILEMDGLKFHRKMETGEIMACGGGGIAILLEALKDFPIKPVEIYYTNSAEVTGIYTGYVVGYASIAFQEI